MVKEIFFFNDASSPEIYTLSLHDALPISLQRADDGDKLHPVVGRPRFAAEERSEEHTSELQSLTNLVCRLLLEKKNNPNQSKTNITNTLKTSRMCLTKFYCLVTSNRSHSR